MQNVGWGEVSNEQDIINQARVNDGSNYDSLKVGKMDAHNSPMK